MKMNESKTDRTIRTVLGAAILVLGLVVGSWWGLLGLIPLVTGLAGFCPIYAALGFSTLPAGRTKLRPGTGAL